MLSCCGPLPSIADNGGKDCDDQDDADDNGKCGPGSIAYGSKGRVAFRWRRSRGLRLLACGLSRVMDQPGFDARFAEANFASGRHRPGHRRHDHAGRLLEPSLEVEEFDWHLRDRFEFSSDVVGGAGVDGGARYPEIEED